MMMNEHFMESEVEYQRQQRLTAAADHRRARSAKRARSLRSRFTAAVGELVTSRGRNAHAA